jgi:ABC-type transporter Mla MlaB component
MLRVTVRDAPGGLTFQLEGRLVGPWVQVTQGCWQRIRARQPQLAFRFDLSGVTMIDDAGKAFLAAAHARGAEFTACGCLMTAIVADLTKNPKNQEANVNRGAAQTT